MSEREFLLSELFNVYGALLTEKRRNLAEQHFAYDFSLSEIAENTDMSRQAVSDALTKTKKQLLDYEQKLGLYRKQLAMEKARELLVGETAERAQTALSLLVSALED